MCRIANNGKYTCEAEIANSFYGVLVIAKLKDQLAVSLLFPHVDFRMSICFKVFKKIQEFKILCNNSRF